MVDNNKDDGLDGDFDEDFDVEEFSEDNFDEAAFDESELADLPEEEFADEDFADDEWQDDEEGVQADKRLLTSGEKKGLSFNTIVIIGAVVVGGGVMAMTIMNKSAEQAAGGKGFFQSILDISGVMDGDFFGAKEEEKTPEQLAAQELQTQNEGFLNNPDVVAAPTSTYPHPLPPGHPPIPTPIAPSEDAAVEGEPLTPMPEDVAMVPTDPNAMPRGPEEGAPESHVAIAETPIDQVPAPVEETAGPSAEDILKQAMANREEKAQAEAPTPEPQPVTETPPREVVAAAEPTPPAAVGPAPSPTPAAEVPAAPSVVPEVLTKNTEALEALSTRLEDVFKRMDQIESDLGTVKNAKQTDTQSLEETIQSLRNEVTELKNRPAPVEKVVERIVERAPEASPEPEAAPERVAEAPKPKAAPKKASKPKPAPKAAAAPSASTRYELRAAQPGRAWVSKPGERDMQSVEVGQTLPGIGRVNAILYQNGRWTVQGTNGQINQ